MGKLFGTDGIRGVAGEAPLDSRTIFAVGRAVGEWLKEKSRSLAPRARDDTTGKVLLGEDTRESSPWVTSYLAGGLKAAGVEAVSAGVLPTPGVAELVRTKGFAAGVVVSASHNPYRDNGIKVIGPTGMKLADEVEAEIEQRIHSLLQEAFTAAENPPVEMSLAEDYAALLRGIAARDMTGGLAGMHLVVDCANGAATRVAPRLLGELGAAVTAIHASPDGRNINDGCGALHPEVVAAKVREIRADFGVAFDGDADRAMFATAGGRVVNGDAVLLLCARQLIAQGRLKGGAVVGTSMSNLGLEVALKKEGLRLARAAVGDRYVLEEMQRSGANLGGEQSGHIIFLDDAPTGDGLLTALKVLAVMRATGKSLEELTSDLKVFPQTIRNLRVREKPPLEALPGVQQAIREAEAALGARGRVVVRYSGTEPLLRVMVEAETEGLVQEWTSRICAAVEKELGN
jgi:phosphoglucosamine mutase